MIRITFVLCVCAFFTTAATAQDGPILVPRTDQALAPPEPEGIEENRELLLQALEELAALRITVNRLEAQLAEFMAIVGRELSESPALIPGPPPPQAPAPNVPRPSLEALQEALGPELSAELGAQLSAEEVLSQLPASPAEDMNVPPDQAPQPPPGAAFDFTIVKEWGREAEEAARLNTASLKGMILAVPEWSADDQLIALGRQLQQEYSGYENVNIEVFNDIGAAQRFAEHGVTNPGHRVLNISRHKDSGRDVVLLIRGENVRTVE